MTPDSGSLVSLDGIHKTFFTRHFFYRENDDARRRIYVKKEVHAAQDINIDIAPGKIFGLLGPNGAGKTTTVKMISGLVKPDKGAVWVEGINVEKSRKEILKRIGVVLEGTRTTIWPLTPMENLRYYGNLKNVRGSVLKKRAHELLDFIGLSEKKDVQVRHMSRGQKQKLAICIALIADPKVILLDEPTTGLDVQSSRAIKDKIIEMTREHGKAVLVTTHDMHVAQELCDTIGIIDQGKLVTCKPMNELIEVFSESVFEFRVDEAPLLDPLRAIPGVVQAEVENGNQSNTKLLVLHLTPKEEFRSEALYNVVTHLRDCGIQLHSINQRQQNLESVFLQLTTSSI